MPLKDIAKNFVTARRSATALTDYPGTIPSVLDESYFIQDQAIALWDKPIIGWKIGRLAPDRQAEHGTERLAGPIFQPMLKIYHGEAVHIPVFEHGFAAVEAEYIFRIGKDAPLAKTDYTEADALDLIDAMFAGIEMAGSPLPTINKLGPTVVASDFGNNFGLILGPQIMAFDDNTKVSDLGEDALKAFRASTDIDGHIVGQGGLFTMPGGPLKAIGWLAGHLARRGKPLRKGQFISSGATTGIHDIMIGQSSTVSFDNPHLSRMELKLQTFRLESDGPELA